MSKRRMKILYHVVSFVLVVIMTLPLLSPLSVYAEEANPSITVQEKIDLLLERLGVQSGKNTYFTVNQKACSDTRQVGHGCSNCSTGNIVQATWFKNIWGNISTSQFPSHNINANKRDNSGQSCFGFACFAQWYVYADSSAESLEGQCVATVIFNKTNIMNYVKPGDVLRMNGHSVLVYAVESTGIRVIDCNWNMGGQLNCVVQKHLIPYTNSTCAGYTTYVNRVTKTSKMPEGMAGIFDVTSSPAPTETGDAYRIVDANYLRIRSNPGTGYSILGTIPCNAKVIVTEYKNGWGKTTYGGTTGWISLVYTKREELRNGIYRIIPKCAPSCVLGLSGNGTEDGTNVEIQERQEGDSQLFAVSKMADGNYLIRNVLSDKMLDVASGSTEAGGNIQIYTENETDSQKWILSAREDNCYIVRSVCSNLALDVSGGLNASGTNVQQWELNYSNAQLFQFEPAGQKDIQAKIEELFVKLGGNMEEFANNGVAKACYFTLNGEPCKRNSNGSHVYGNDSVWSIIRTKWFGDIFGVEKLGGDKQFPDVNQFPKHTVSGKVGDENNSGRQCFGFACFAQWYLYKESNEDYVTGSRVGQGTWGAEFLKETAQPGDILRLPAVPHSMIVYAVEEDGVIVLDCNNCGKSEPCRVALQKIKWERWSGKTVYVYSGERQE